jgi:hypothetical protein
MEYVHGFMDRVHAAGSWVHGPSLNEGRLSSDLRSRSKGRRGIFSIESWPHKLDWTVEGSAPTGRGADAGSWQRAMAERGDSPEFRFSRTMVISFQ